VEESTEIVPPGAYHSVCDTVITRGLIGLGFFYFAVDFFSSNCLIQHGIGSGGALGDLRDYMALEVAFNFSTG